MKISIQKRILRTDGTRSLRLVYDHATPQTPTQRQHNKEHMLLAETIKSKRLVRWI